MREEKTGFGEITHFDASGYKCHLAAEVKNFDGKNYMDPKAAKRMELFCQYAVAATKEAIADAGLEMEKEDPYLVGTAIGSGVGSLQAIEREYKKLLEKGPGRVNPLLVPMMIFTAPEAMLRHVSLRCPKDSSLWITATILPNS